MFKFVLQEMKNSISSARPLLLDDKNYSYWKIKVKAYITAIDESVWRSILIGWTPPTIITDSATTLKSEETWSKEESALATTNFKALNAIFAPVDANQFKQISSCECARDVSNILQTTHKGTPLLRSLSYKCLPPDLRI